MELWQKSVIVVVGIYSLIGFLKALHECRNKKNAYGLIFFYSPIGAFVWADVVIFGLFWAVVSLITLLLNDWILFLLFISVFWLVRSFGETIYWLNEQFSPLKNNPPERFIIRKIFHNESVWFVLQIFWQCIMVTTIIITLYLATLWITTKL